MDIEKTPNQRHGELQAIVAAQRERLRNNQLSPDALAQYVAILLAGRAVEFGDLNEVSTVKAVNETWQRNLDYFGREAQEFVNKTGAENVLGLALTEDGGAALERAFRMHLHDRDRIPQDTPPRMMLKAGYRIQQIKKRMNNGEFATTDRKRMAIAELVACREAVDAGRDSLLFYDGKLLKILPTDISVRAEKIEEELKKLTERDIDRLFDKAKGYGHGQKMLDDFDQLRKNPARREVERIRELREGDGDDRIRSVAAQMLWLNRNWNMTKEELAAAKENGTMAEEVQAISDSPEFCRFMNSRSMMELANLIKAVDVTKPDGMKVLTDAYEESASEHQMFAAEIDPIYSELFGNPKNWQKLTDNLGQLLSNKDFKDILKSSGVGDVTLDALNRLNEVMLEENEQTVKEAIDKARAQLTWLRFGEKNQGAFQEICSQYQELQAISDCMKLPEPGTGKEYAMCIRGAILSEGPKSVGGQKYLFRKALFSKLTRENPEWENMKVDAIKLNEEAEKMEEAVAPLGNVLEEQSVQTAYHIVDVYDGGAKAEAYLDEWTKEMTRKKQEIQENTPEDRVEELLRLPLREKYAQKPYTDLDEQEEVIVEIMAARSLSREFREHPEKFPTAEEVEDRFLRLRGSFAVFGEAQQDVAENHAGLIMADRTGEKLEAAFKKAMIGHSDTRDWIKADPLMLPTAREQIEGLQLRIKKNRLTRSIEKERAISQILAARELLQVRRGQRGGDERLDQPMTKQMFQRAETIRASLEKLPQEQFDRLWQKVREGHGGAMEQEYRSILRKQSAKAEKLTEDMAPEAMPTAKERIEALQAKLQTLEEPGEKLKCVAGIIAARQTVGAKRGSRFGGDEKLNQRLDPTKLAEREQDVELYLSSIPAEIKEKLIAQAVEGHGGAMQGTYKAANTYNAQLYGLQMRAGRDEPVDMAMVLAMAPKAKNGNEPVNEEAVRKSMQRIRSEKGYESFAKDPKSKELLMNGEYSQLAKNYFVHASSALEIQVVKKPEEPEKQGPEQQEAEAEAAVQP